MACVCLAAFLTAATRPPTPESITSPTADPQDLPDMEDVFEAIKDSPGVKRGDEDLKTFIQNAKRSTAN